MNLTLEIISDQRASLGDEGVKSFTVHGGSIGRSVSNDWVLPDTERFLSGRHASIQFQKGSFFIIDTSTNGVFVDDAQTPLGRGKYRRLRGGEKIRLGPYEIAVTVTSAEELGEKAPEDMSLEEKDELISVTAVLEDEANAGGDTETNLETGLRDTPGGQVGPASDSPGDDWNMIHLPATGERPVLDIVDQDPSMELMPGFDLQPQKLTELELELEKEEQEARESQPPAARKRERRARKPAPVTPSAAKPKTASQSRPASTPKQEKAEVETATGCAASSGTYRGPKNDHSLAQLLQAAGLDPASIPATQSDRVLQTAGQIIREFIVGVMEVLQTRAELKTRFRVSQTTIQSGEFNPLKFSADVDEAMRGLLFRGKDHYLPGVESVRQSFTDLKHHEMAMLVAMQSAVEDMLERFDPAQLKERFDSGLKRGPLMGATNKMKYWELYEEFFQFVGQNGDGAIPQFFSDAFARAYESEIERLKTRRKRRRSSSA
jgi:type VI secretion system protein